MGDDEFPTVTPLYVPWQLLYLDDVLRATKADFGVETLLLSAEQREQHIGAYEPGWSVRMRFCARLTSSGVRS
jgi:hypothetical protein